MLLRRHPAGAGRRTPEPLPDIGAAWNWAEPFYRRGPLSASPCGALTTSRGVLPFPETDSGAPSPLRLAITHISRPQEVNPKGIPSQSPGLRAASYPGLDAKMSLNPNGVVALIPQQTDATPLGLAVSGRFSQGSSRRATLGWRTQSLWD